MELDELDPQSMHDIRTRRGARIISLAYPDWELGGWTAADVASGRPFNLDRLFRILGKDRSEYPAVTDEDCGFGQAYDNDYEGLIRAWERTMSGMVRGRGPSDPGSARTEMPSILV